MEGTATAKLSKLYVEGFEHGHKCVLMHINLQITSYRRNQRNALVGVVRELEAKINTLQLFRDSIESLMPDAEDRQEWHNETQT